MDIRDERDSDGDAIRRIHTSAFETAAEADLVDALRKAGAICASLVAVVDERIVGHVLFSPARLDLDSRAEEIAALGPVAVLAEYRRKGIGESLIRAGLERCRSFGFPAVIVLGNPRYYRRFGFERADAWGNPL